MTSSCLRLRLAARLTAAWFLICSGAAAQDSAAKASESEPPQFDRLCSGCHGDAGRGGERGPALVNNRGLRSRSETQIHDLIREALRAGCRVFLWPK
jgi:hypothetical protein